MSNTPFQTLQGKVAIITGGSRGLGRGFALELARRGAKVAVTYTSSSSADLVTSLQSEISSLSPPGECIGLRGDLRDPSVPESLVQQTIAAFGPHIDILVNNAGAELYKPISEHTVEDYEYITNLNVRAPLLLVKAVLPYLRKPGRIINIGSVAARQGFAEYGLYCMSKAALEGFTRSWAIDLGGEGHTVNCVNPGPVHSDMLEQIPKYIVERQKSMTPVENRIGNGDDVSQIVVWLASEESRWVTGQAISASGGLYSY